ncbi:MAG: peroxidase-related enzyme [Alsobacter sp.]
MSENKARNGEQPRPQGSRDAPMELDLPPAPPTREMAAYFDKCREKIGFVPNVLAAYAHDMTKLEAFVAFYNDLMLAPSPLGKLEREMIAVVVSAENRCFYCVAAHGAAVRQLSGDPILGELLATNWRAADLSPRHRAMLAFAETMTRASHTIGAADRQLLREAGFDDRGIWDIAAVASFFNMSNRMASAVDMRPNDAYHAQAR